MTPTLKGFLYAVITVTGLLSLIVYAGQARSEAPPGVPTYVLPDGGQDEAGKDIVYYSVPFLKLDGSISTLDIDNSLPLQFLVCNEQPENRVLCLVRGTAGGVGTVTL